MDTPTERLLDRLTNLRTRIREHRRALYGSASLLSWILGLLLILVAQFMNRMSGGLSALIILLWTSERTLQNLHHGGGILKQAWNRTFDGKLQRRRLIYWMSSFGSWVLGIVLLIVAPRLRRLPFGLVLTLLGLFHLERVFQNMHHGGTFFQFKWETNEPAFVQQPAPEPSPIRTSPLRQISAVAYEDVESNKVEIPELIRRPEPVAFNWTAREDGVMTIEERANWVKVWNSRRNRYTWSQADTDKEGESAFL